MVAPARLVEAYERTEWPRTAPTLPVLLACLMDQHGLSRAEISSAYSTVLNWKGPVNVRLPKRSAFLQSARSPQ